MFSETILYVDDDIINLQLFEINLKRKFYILTAIGGAKALEMMSSNPDIKAVISDMNMPEMNGLEFISEAQQRHPDIPCFILTGYEITEDIEHALKNGMIKKYFQKPYDLNELSNEIKECLN